MTFEELIVKKRREEDSEWHKPKAGIYHASQIYYITSGELTPEKFFEKQEFEDRTLIIFAIGEMYHEFIQSLFPDAEKEKQICIEGNGFKIVGRMDLQLKDKKIIELKSCSRLPSEPYLAHIQQVQCYMHATGEQEAYIAYLEKNSKAFPERVFKVTKDENIISEILEKVEAFDKKVKEISK